MRRVSRILIALFFCTLVLGGSLAAVQAQTNVTVDLTKMEPDVAAKILESQRQRGEVKTRCNGVKLSRMEFLDLLDET